MEDFLKVGVISSTHGVRGEVKVYPTTDDPARFKKLKTVLMDDHRQRIPMEIVSVKFFKQMVILKFKGYDTLNDVEKFRTNELYVSREQAVPLEEDEYFIADLIGLKVFLEDGTEYGVLDDVLQTGANDVYVIRRPMQGEILVPAIGDCILDVRVEEGTMTIRLMEGLE